MRYYVNLATGQLWSGPNGDPVGTKANPLEIFRADSDDELQFLQTGAGGVQTPVRLPDGTTFTFPLYAVGKYESAAVVGMDASSVVRPATDDGFYTFKFLGDTTEAQALLLTPDGNLNNDRDNIALAGQLSWTLPDAPKETQTKRIYANLYNTYSTSASLTSATPSDGVYVNSPSGKAKVFRVATDTDAARGAALIAAAAAANDGDTITLGPGRYDVGTEKIVVPMGGALIGQGDSTIIYGERAFTSQGGAVVAPQSECYIANMKISTELETSVTSPSGLKVNGSSDAPASGVVVENVLFYGGQDTVLVLDSINTTPTEITFLNCRLVTFYDGYFLGGTTSSYRLIGCSATSEGSPATIHPIVAQGSTVQAIGCFLDARLGSSSSALAQVIGSARVELMGCQMEVGASGGSTGVLIGSGSIKIAGGVMNISAGGSLGVVSGGTAELAGFLIGGSANNRGLTVSDGSVTLNGVRVDTSANGAASPITKSGGTLILGSGVVLVAESTRDSISAATAQTVLSYGAYANKAVDSDVTITGTLNVNAAVI